MKLFDLHCDTAGECLKQRKPLLSNDLHIDLCKGERLDKWSQIFAIWIPDELRGKEALDYFNSVYKNFRNEISLNKGKIALYQGIEDLDVSEKSNEITALISCEGASPFAFEGGIELANRYGVKVITLTWNAENELGFGCQSGCENGLKPLGKRLLSDMAECGIVADVSHLNRRGFYDALESDAAVIASHSNSVSVLNRTRKDCDDKFFSCRRNLDDEQIKLLSQKGGLIGINFCNSFLGDEGDDGREAVWRHISHMLDLGAENSIALGSDYDGCEISNELCGVDKMPHLADFLISKGLGKALVEKIFYENAYNFFKSILQT
ncbi:MAG: membrane dipeptidase [Clostridia bacterium]|nr:membrane dipeptidase [Clostridia bacterium]